MPAVLSLRMRRGKISRHLCSLRIDAAVSQHAALRELLQTIVQADRETRDGARVPQRYHAPLTPFLRVQAHPAVAREKKAALDAQFRKLYPVMLLHDIRLAQARFVMLAALDLAPQAVMATLRTPSRWFANRS